jgi:predicted methyltransferase
VHADPATNAANAALVARYRQRFAEPKVFGRIDMAVFSPASPPPALAGSVDLALFLCTVHTWMAAGLAEKAFADAHAILRPGGVLGVEQHRASPGAPQDPLAISGYVQQSYVRRLAEEAGFAFDGASEINANPATIAITRSESGRCLQCAVRRRLAPRRTRRSTTRPTTRWARATA